MEDENKMITRYDVLNELLDEILLKHMRFMWMIKECRKKYVEVPLFNNKLRTAQLNESLLKSYEKLIDTDIMKLKYACDYLLGKELKKHIIGTYESLSEMERKLNSSFCRKNIEELTTEKKHFNILVEECFYCI